MLTGFYRFPETISAFARHGTIETSGDAAGAHRHSADNFSMEDAGLEASRHPVLQTRSSPKGYPDSGGRGFCLSNVALHPPRPTITGTGR